MSVETYFRFIFGLVAIGMAMFLIGRLVTGRSRLGRRPVDRRSEPRSYWASVGNSVIVIAALGIGAVLPPQSPTQIVLPILFVGLFGGQLFVKLVSGISLSGGRTSMRTDQPRDYWRSVAVEAAVVIAFAVLLILSLTTTRAP